MSYGIWRSGYWNGTYFFNGERWIYESVDFTWLNGTFGYGRNCSDCSPVGSTLFWTGDYWQDLIAWQINFDPESYSSFQYWLE